MSRQRHETSLTPRPPITRILAAVAIGAVGRALWHLTVDAFVLYVFGDPAREPRKPFVARGAEHPFARPGHTAASCGRRPGGDRLAHHRVA